MPPVEVDGEEVVGADAGGGGVAAVPAHVVRHQLFVGEAVLVGVIAISETIRILRKLESLRKVEFGGKASMNGFWIEKFRRKVSWTERFKKVILGF